MTSWTSPLSWACVPTWGRSQNHSGLLWWPWSEACVVPQVSQFGGESFPHTQSCYPGQRDRCGVGVPSRTHTNMNPQLMNPWSAGFSTSVLRVIFLDNQYYTSTFLNKGVNGDGRRICDLYNRVVTTELVFTTPGVLKYHNTRFIH